MEEETLRREKEKREEEERRRRQEEIKKKKDVDTGKIKKRDPNGKKVLKTKEKITTSETNYSYKIDPFSKKIITISNKI